MYIHVHLNTKFKIIGYEREYVLFIKEGEILGGLRGFGSVFNFIKGGGTCCEHPLSYCPFMKTLRSSSLEVH